MAEDESFIKGYQTMDLADDGLNGEMGCFFRDGVRKIDYVLVFSEEVDKEVDLKIVKYREKYLENLRKSHLEMEEEITIDNLHFIKCHCPFEVLKFYAEELSFRAPLQRRDTVKTNWTERMLAKFHLPNPFQEEVPNPPPDYFTTTFQAEKMYKFIGNESPETYFNDTQRSRVAYEILETAPYGKRQRGEIGIERLVSEGCFAAAYPLHVGPHTRQPYLAPEDGGIEPEPEMNNRQILKNYWGRWGKWSKYQPLDHIRFYFGEKIGLYFAWLGQYTAWLILPSFVGLLVFIYGVLTINSLDNKDAIDICKAKKGEYRMCPRCDEKFGCKYWDLKESCNLVKVSYLFDNAATVFFAIFVSFWAVFFLEFWKRKEITLAYHWDCLGFESEEERPRPTFAALAPTVERNPITGIMEPHFPEDKRKRRLFSGIIVIVTMVSLVLIFMIGVIVYKLLVYRPLAKSSLSASRALQIANISGAFCNLLCILILSRVYEKVALALTHWEMHRTQTEYEDNLTFKVFVFQFVNFYGSIFYIAFFKGKLIGYPGNYKKLMGLRQEECGPGGCLIELAQQLVIIMVGKQLIGNIQEIAIPLIKQKLQKRKRGKSDVDKPRWEDDYELAENEGLFAEYLEMVIQFGFITIFVAAFPLAPFFALANNIFEIRIDSNKLVCETRRPIAERAQDLGVWFNILEAVAKIAVISNAFLIAFTSNFLPKLLYRYKISKDGSLEGYLNYSLALSPKNATLLPCRYRDFRHDNGHLTAFYWHLLALKLGFVIIFEHFVFATHILIDFLVPDIPESLDIAIKREAYLAKRAMSGGHALAETEDELDDKSIEGKL
ncbi:anoctamin-7-like [Rhopilema esculentum]|uniref:anoctamin-7-like n=1 Tax=Rhopilema esculentum TaxID=499914 RepID=UPI0031DC5B7A|eukprot:gene6718-12280_t